MKNKIIILVIVFSAVCLYAQTGTVANGRWDAGYVSNVEIFKNTCTYSVNYNKKFIRLTTSRYFQVVEGSGASSNSENYCDGYHDRVVYIPWDSNDDLYSSALFSSLQKAIDDQTKSVVFYSVKYNTWEATEQGVAMIVYSLRIF